ncbi:MAG: NAD(P)/FAD-dependent oxidoreductase [Caulobacteraceae bacterium]|nr:NAD(P)/FAD-dependent oxidoreductase [Caulobacteraceae bacterium]
MIDQALAEAHLPALLMSLIHITGDASLLSDELKPAYDFFAEGRLGGYSQATQDKLRAMAKAAISDYMAGDGVLPPPPDPATIRRMMDFIAGVEVPERYVPLLMEELSLDGVDQKLPSWDTPQLKSAAAKTKVLIIGAGMSGLLTAIRLQQAGIAFEIIDKNADVGGTWLENTYPGCRVDNPSHLYSLSFEPNHEWPQHFSTQPVLLKYFQDVAERHGLRRHMRLNTTVKEARFDEAAKLWRVTIRRPDGAEEVLTANAVVSAVGQLNQPNLPNIEGRDSFAGVAFHSAQWRGDVDLTGKRVAVIGTGASAFQFVPEIAPKVADMVVFQRTPPWLGPTPNYHDDVTERERWLLQHVPYYEKWYRFWLFWMMTDGLLDAITGDPDYQGPPTAVSQVNAELREMLIGAMALQTEGDPELLAKITPQYPLGGKRSVRDNGVWIAALRRPNVHLITEAITRITPKGVVTADGTEHEVDVIIYGAGFKASDFLRTFEVHGRDGVELHDQWKGDARAYLGMTVPNFPNFFVVYGPNTNIVVNGSIIFFSECSVRYIIEALKLLAETGKSTLEPKQAVHDAFNEKVDAANRGMAWGAPQVNSWYKNATGRVSQNWPFRLIDYWNATLKPNPDDFVIR